MEIGAERKVDIMHFIDDLRIMTDAAWKMEKAHDMLCRFCGGVGMKLDVSKCGVIANSIPTPHNMADIPAVNTAGCRHLE